MKDIKDIKDTKSVLQKAQQGDNEAVEKLLIEYKGLLYKASSQHHLLSIKDEAYAQACISFYEAVMRFDESLGVPFAGFAKSKVYQGVHGLFRRHLRIWQNEVASCNKMAGDELEDGECIDGLIFVKDIADDIIDRVDLYNALTKLPPGQKRVLIKILFEDLSMKQTAKELHISAQAVSKNYAKAISSLRAFIVQPIKYH